MADDDDRADEAGRAGVENDDDEEEEDDDDEDDEDEVDGDEDGGISECAILSGAHTIAHRLKSWLPSSDAEVAWRSPSTMRNAVRSVSADCHSAVSVHISCDNGNDIDIFGYG